MFKKKNGHIHLQNTPSLILLVFYMKMGNEHFDEVKKNKKRL